MAVLQPRGYDLLEGLQPLATRRIATIKEQLTCARRDRSGWKSNGKEVIIHVRPEDTM